MRGITGPDLYRRWCSADAAADLRDLGGLDAREGRTLAWVLAWAAAVETGWYSARPRWSLRAAVTRQAPTPARWSIRCGFLTSLIELAADGWVPAAALDLVIDAIPTSGVAPDEAATYEQLVDARSWPLHPTPPHDRPNLPGVGPGEPVGAGGCLDIVGDLAAEGVALRRAAALTVAGWADASRLDDGEAATLGTVLTWVVRIETTDARAALLTALDAIARRDRVPPWALDELLTALPAAKLDGTELSLWVSLATALADHRRRVPGCPMGGPS